MSPRTLWATCWPRFPGHGLKTEAEAKDRRIQNARHTGKAPAGAIEKPGKCHNPDIFSTMIQVEWIATLHHRETQLEVSVDTSRRVTRLTNS
jgi:hypothetical protein